MPDAKKCPKYKFVRFAEPSRRGGRKGGKESKKVSSIKPKGIVSKKKIVSAKKLPVPKSAYSSKGSRSSNSTAIAPVLGSMKASHSNYHSLGSVNDDDDFSDSSSSELSSATDNELVIDS